MIKVIRKGIKPAPSNAMYETTCTYCSTRFAYQFEDIDQRALGVHCPTCSVVNVHHETKRVPDQRKREIEQLCSYCGLDKNSEACQRSHP